jgi:hypothetical protein
MKEKAAEIVLEEKLHIIETEEIIEAEIPTPVQEIIKVDGKFVPKNQILKSKFKILYE